MTADETASGHAVSPDRMHGTVAVALATVVLAMTVIGLAVSERGIALAPGLPAWLAVTGFVGQGVMLVATWVVRAERPRVASGLSVAMTGLVVPSWAAWDWLPVAAVPLLLATAPIAVAGASHVGLGWAGRTGWPRVLTVAYLLAGLGVFLMAVAYDPLADPACIFSCADADPAAGPFFGTRIAVTAVSLLVVTAAAVSGTALAAERRATSAPVRLCAGAGLVLLAAGWVLHAVWWSDPVPGVLRVGLMVVSAVLLAGGVLASWCLTRRDRMAAERLVAELNDATAGSGVLPGAHRAEFFMPDEDRWVDAMGRPVTVGRLDGGSAVLHEGDGPAVRLRAASGASPPTLDELSPSARVALANARLEAVTRARLREVQESRRRIVRASDAERRRIERDLHDGAQQRLISASLHVSIAAERLPGASVDRAQAAIREALEQLRRLAHGLLPEALRTGGLRVALEDLVRAAGVPTSFEVDDVAVDDDVGVAIHAAVMAVLAHARGVRARRAAIHVTSSSSNRLELRIEVDALTGLEAWDETAVTDRLGAAGAMVTVEAEPDRLVLRAELPCVS